ncbi:hypothetical protein C8J45_102388 [Sphingomonas sp. PP-CE-3G-477]|nr:hypothetical protein C8J45_102388 [Sphingomonas sp. PP-CE-3G-477]
MTARFALDYPARFGRNSQLQDIDLRRRTQAGLNKGKARNALVRDPDSLREAMVRRAARAAEIRAQGLVASRIIAFAHGSRYKPNAPSASLSARLSPATHDPRTIASVASNMMDSMFVPSSIYTKCGVMLEGLHAAGEAQTDLFATIDTKAAPLLAATDGLNGRFGRNTVRIAAEG